MYSNEKVGEISEKQTLRKKNSHIQDFGDLKDPKMRADVKGSCGKYVRSAYQFSYDKSVHEKKGY